MKIVPERPQDLGPIEALNDAAFGPNRANKTVYRLRDGLPPDRALCFVALNEEGALCASLRFWPIVIGKNKAPAVLLGPLAVVPELRGQGYGKALMRHGIDQARKLGHRIIVLVGDPEYYNPFGFTREAALKLSLPGPVEERRFLALPLADGAMEGAVGMIGRPDAAAPAKKARRRSAR
jgi:predicted N-acetyltransferase YhbS